MTNKSIDPIFISALDVLIGILGVFIILNFLNSRLVGAQQPQQPLVAKAEPKPDKQKTNLPAVRPEKPIEQRWTNPSKPAPAPALPAPAPVTAPAPAKPLPTPAPVAENPAPAPPQDPVSVDLMKQTKGVVTLLLQQDGKSKQTVEFMLRQGGKTWKPGRASKYQNDEFKYEKALTYFYQTEIQPGTYEVMIRVKRGNSNAGSQSFALFGKIIPSGQKTQTQQFGTYAANSTEWISAGTFTVTASSIGFKSALPPASANKPTEETSLPQPETPKTRPKKVGKWG